MYESKASVCKTSSGLLFSRIKLLFFFLFMSLCVSLSLPTSSRRPAIPGTVKSYAWVFYRSPVASEKSRGGCCSCRLSPRHTGTRRLGAPPLALAIVTRNLPLRRRSDSSRHRVQAKVSQGHIRPPSALIPLSPFLHSKLRRAGNLSWRIPQGGFTALQPSCQPGQFQHPLPGSGSRGNRSAVSHEEGTPWGRSSLPSGRHRQQGSQELCKFTSSPFCLEEGLFPAAPTCGTQGARAGCWAAVCWCGEGAVGDFLPGSNIPAFS